MLSCSSMRKVQTIALLLGLVLAVLTPAFAAAGAADCGMSCCRLGLPMSHAGMPDCGGHARCSMRGCAGGAPVAALAGLPPTVLPALLAPATLVFAAPLGRDAFRLPFRLASDLPDRPPRAA